VSPSSFSSNTAGLAAAAPAKARRQASSNPFRGTRVFTHQNPRRPHNDKPDRMIAGQENGRIRENRDGPPRLTKETKARIRVLSNLPYEKSQA
jgi:hypothetical protein